MLTKEKSKTSPQYDYLNLARRLIKNCQETQNPYLDLGKCGINDLNELPELFDCDHIETLVLSNEWWTLINNSQNTSQNDGKLNKINFIPNTISNLKNIKNLIISGNQISDISFLEKLTGLQSLNLRFTQISDISSLKKLTELQSLDIGNNKISDINFLKNLTKLQSLDIGNNKISNISFLEKLTELQFLDLSSNQISDYSVFGELIGLQYLNLSSIKTSDISSLGKLTGLQYLNLSSNQIYDFRFFEKLTLLQSLNLNFNEIFDYSFIEELTGLQSLYLKYNKISDISFLEKLIELQSLDLSYNKITDISFLNKLTKLQSLDLNRNEISNISFLKNMTSLKSLSLNSNKISDISFLEKLTGLLSLNLSSNEIFDIRSFNKLTGLQFLDLSSNKISNIRFLEKLTGLQFLNLSGNKIHNVIVLEMTGLKSLDLSNNIISNIFFGKLNGLQSLDLSSNKIFNINILEELTELQYLDISINKISDISFLEKLTRLQSLNLSINKISDYSILEKLTKLKSLNLMNNRISDINFLGKLTGLQSLNLSINNISNISFLEKLTSLQSLDLGNNKISNIMSIEKLTNLYDLNLKENNIEEVPIFIFHRYKSIDESIFFSNFSVGLNLYGNPINVPPLEIIKQGRQSVLDWFEAIKEKLNEIKIILIGEPKAGKTSLLRRLKDNSFNENETQTDGVNIENITFGKCETFIEQASLHGVIGHFWDFGGQEILNATHQFFLTKRSVYLLVLEARKDANSSEQIRHWVQRVRATGGESPIVVLANKIDDYRGFGFENERELKTEFPQIKYFIKLSCKTNENIKLLKESIAELIPTTELFNTEIDKRWITIKNNLQKETKKYLTQQQFRKICITSGLTDNKMQKDVITFLHDLGSILHFDDLSLADYYVLNPYWITYGAYQILTSKFAGDNNGIIVKDKLEFIVNEEENKKDAYRSNNFEKIEYEPNEIIFLTKVLQEFKLCFWTTDSNYFIISDLLDTKEPLEITDPIRSSNERIEFIYEYDYLPKSVMPNIIVDAHRMITHMWRTGCVLQKDSIKALITSYKNQILIMVTGEHKKKCELMAFIRTILYSINKNLSNKPVELIPLPEVNDTVEYELLLEMEKVGRKDYIYHEFKKTQKSFSIKMLLEGIEEIKKHEPLQELIAVVKEIKSDTNKIKVDTQKIINELNLIFEELIKKSSINKTEIINAMAELNDQQTVEIIHVIGKWFNEYYKEMDNYSKRIHKNLKKTSNVEMKLKLSIPFIKLLGINFETTFDVKNWAKEQYKNNELLIWKLIGAI